MRYRANCFTTLAAAAVLTLGACGDGGEQEVAEANMAAPAGDVAPDAIIIYPAGTEGSLEMNAMRSEVDRLRGQGGAGASAGAGGAQAGGAAGSMDTGNQSSTAGMTGAETQNQSGTAGTAGTQGGASGSSAGMSAAQPGAAAGMAGFDRDSDGRLSPAEYAIFALPSETPARQGATNDEKPPFVSDEALNKVVTSFRRLDRNGDFFLSAEEFQPNSR